MLHNDIIYSQYLNLLSITGVAQVTIMGPCTFLVTASVTDKSKSLWQHALSTYKSHGVGGFYHGGTALVLRQGFLRINLFSNYVKCEL